MLSVIIATSESERALLRTLAILVPGAAAGLVREVIVADGGSSDATTEVADLAGCRVLISPASLAARLKGAAAAARAPWLMFLRPGTLLDVTWVDDVARFLEQDGTRAATFRPVRDTAQPLLTEALMLLRLAIAGRPHADQGLLIARALYDRMAGHRERADTEEDLMQRLGRRRIAILRSGATGARK